MEALSTSGPDDQAAYSEAYRALIAQGPVERREARAQVEAVQKDAQTIAAMQAQAQLQAQQQAQQYWGTVYLRQLDHAHEQRLEQMRLDARREEREAERRREQTKPFDWLKVLAIAIPAILALVQLLRQSHQPPAYRPGECGERRRRTRASSWA